MTARFKLPVPRGVVYLSRTHPMVEGLADYVMNATMDAHEATRARRCGVVLTRDVEEETTLLLMRSRYHLISRNGSTRELLAEEVQPLAYRGRPQSPTWLTDAGIDDLLQAAPAGNSVRKLSQRGRVRYEVRPELPADLLGVYVFAPVKT